MLVFSLFCSIGYSQPSESSELEIKNDDSQKCYDKFTSCLNKHQMAGKEILKMLKENLSGTDLESYEMRTRINTFLYILSLYIAYRAFGVFQNRYL